MATTAEKLTVLRVGRAYVVQGWCQGAIARTDDGEPTLAAQPWAEEWCSEGALEAAAHGLVESDEWVEALYCLQDVLAVREPENRGVSRWQDEPHRTKEDVIDLFDAGIARLEEFLAERPPLPG